MHRKINSPVSVEIIARFGKKVSIRIRLGLTVGAVVVLISAVSKLLG